MALGEIRIAAQSLFIAAAVAGQLLFLIGCASLRPSKDWQADVFDERTRTMLAQIGLRSEGFDTGPVDGIEGPRTRAATVAFRRARGIPVTDSIDAQLVETIFYDHDLDQAMPYVEGLFRSCFRWGPNRVIIMASNLGTLTCTIGAGREVKNNEIAMAEEFCLKAVPLRSDVVKCELIYDGKRIVNHQRLMQLLDDPSPDFPVLLRSQDVAENLDSKTNATLRSAPPLYQFPRSVYDLKPPTVQKTPLRAQIIGIRGRTICEGTVTPIDPALTRYDMTCFGNTPIHGEARLVGVVPVGDLLLPAYETTAKYKNLEMSLIPPSNTIRLDFQKP